MDKYLKKEVGNRREITSSMVARADKARWLGYTPYSINMQYYFNSLVRQQMAAYQPLPNQYGALGGALAGSSLGSSLSALSAKCPYCGR